MYLKTLELHGFKSFPEKTVLHFNAGTTVIVGPNGSGKSNITDAMRWVLGELSTKNIRGTKMEDVIFIGADGYRPMGFAEVSVTFDDSEQPRRLNSPYEEITVTRRYYRAGESEYFINRKPCRLKDIYELFMNTGIGREGYSIIGQGKIAEIISKKSDDRRGIFEETAGISKFRYKKQESQKKLAETEANMVRLTDIFNEIESRIGPLERDAKKARRYLELFGEKKSLDVSMWLYDMAKIKADIEKTAADCKMSEHELEIADDTKSQFEAQSDRLYDASRENKEKSQRLYETIQELTGELHSTENSYRVLENDAEHAELSIENKKTEIENAKEQIGIKTARLEELERSLEDAKALFSENEKKLFDLYNERDKKQNGKKEKEDLIEKLLAVQKEHEAKISDLTVRLGVLKTNLSDSKKRGATIGEDIKRHREELENMIRSSEDAKASTDLYDKALADASEEIAKLNEEDGALRAKGDEVKDVINLLAGDIGALESRIGALKRMSENFDGYNYSVKYVMGEAAGGRLDGIEGPVSHLITVQDKYIIAVETALGANLQNVIVRDERAAKDAMFALKRAKAGRATFYPVSTVKAPFIPKEVENASRYAGFVGYADTLLKYDKKYDGIIKYLLARIPVFDDIDHATEMARSEGWRVRAVTLDGQQVNAGGSFTGGSVKHDSGVLSRNSHIEKLTADKSALESDLEKAKKSLAEIESERASVLSKISALSEKVSITETLMRAERSSFDEECAKIEVKKALIADLERDAAGLDENSKQGEEDVARLEAELSLETDKMNEVSSKRFEEDAAANAIREAIDADSEELSRIQIAMTENRKDAENAETLVAECRADIASLNVSVDTKTAEIEETVASIAKMKRDVEDAKNKAALIKDSLSKAEADRQSLEQGGLDYERKINEIRHKLDEISSKKEILFVAHTKNQNKLDNLNAESEKMTTRLWDEYELTEMSAAALELPEITKDNRPELYKRLTELKNSIKALGHVNPDAIDEYAEQKERYDTLGAQLADLNKSKGELEKIISSIEEEMKTMFVKTFDEVNENFKQVFRELFGGGTAHLSLTDPDNVLTSGIEISAAPPGKMIKNLSLLSGGEQSFVAIALIFALIKVNPSPFCIFDEIEAALDEVNVTRVANYIKSYSKELQMIVISHRRGLMEVADSLYGVTMPRRGISKVFVLDVDSVSEKTMTENAFVE